MTLFCVLLVAVLGAETTFFLIHKRRVSVVRASSGATLTFALLIGATGFSLAHTLMATFFGATFVGMTDSSHMGWKRVLFASLIFGLIFVFLIPLAEGIGGSLGTAAFVSVAVTSALSALYKRILK